MQKTIAIAVLTATIGFMAACVEVSNKELPQKVSSQMMDNSLFETSTHAAIKPIVAVSTAIAIVFCIFCC